MAIEYLGSKRQLLDFIVAQIEKHSSLQQAHVLDLFSGTGVVSGAMKKSGWQVTANDWLYFCCILTESILLNRDPPRFDGLAAAGIIPKSVQDRYGAALSELERLPPKKGFIYRTYSPGAKEYGELPRMYYTEANAKRIDGIREAIDRWTPHLSRAERSLLLSDLLIAANAVSNIAGTYGCFLKHWKRRANERLQLRKSGFVGGSENHSVFQEDAASLIKRMEVDVVYADPPYTKRQYSAYYHVLETIAAADEPQVGGLTGLREWHSKSSDFCYRRKAPKALQKLVEHCRSRHFFLSYNEDGQIDHDTIMEILSARGAVSVFERALRRYKSSRLAHKGPAVTERLYHLALA